MDVNPEYTPGSLDIDNPIVKYLDNRVGALPVSSQFPINAKEVLYVEEDQLSHREQVVGRLCVMVGLGGGGRGETFLGGQLSTQLQPLKPLGR